MWHSIFTKKIVFFFPKMGGCICGQRHVLRPLAAEERVKYEWLIKQQQLFIEQLQMKETVPQAKACSEPLEPFVFTLNPTSPEDTGGHLYQWTVGQHTTAAIREAEGWSVTKLVPGTKYTYYWRRPKSLSVRTI